MNPDKIQTSVKKHYGKGLAENQTACCGEAHQDHAQNIGYTQEDIERVPEGANLGLGCGNPLMESEIMPGDTILDLGSGAGFDSFIAAAKTGPTGLVIGVDMTPEMIHRANENKNKAGIQNIDFRLGYIENLPVESASVDLVSSNCVINLSTNKERVFQEAFRVLKSGGTLLVSDIVLLRDLPRMVRNNVQAYVGCIAGAAKKDTYLAAIKNAGFVEINILEERSVSDMVSDEDPILRSIIKYIPLPSRWVKSLSGRYAESLKIKARKPAVTP